MKEWACTHAFPFQWTETIPRSTKLCVFWVCHTKRWICIFWVEECIRVYMCMFLPCVQCCCVCVCACGLGCVFHRSITWTESTLPLKGIDLSIPLSSLSPISVSLSLSLLSFSLYSALPLSLGWSQVLWIITVWRHRDGGRETGIIWPTRGDGVIGEGLITRSCNRENGKEELEA